MEERRKSTRVNYSARSVIVDVQSGEKYYVRTENISPLGMGILADDNIPNLIGKDIIIVAQTLIMYADVIRQVPNEDGTYTIGINARHFTDDVLEYLFEHIAPDSED